VLRWWGSQKGNGRGDCWRCASKGGRLRGKNGARRRRAAPFLNGVVGSRGRGERGGLVAQRDAWKEGNGGLMSGRDSVGSRQQPGCDARGQRGMA
jgi:hypothetical protein